METPIFPMKYFKDKKTILILAKTFGAADTFYAKSDLRKLVKKNNVNVEYLYDKEQITKLTFFKDVIVIKLYGAEDIYENCELEKICRNRNIKILSYNFSHPEVYNEVVA